MWKSESIISLVLETLGIVFWRTFSFLGSGTYSSQQSVWNSDLVKVFGFLSLISVGFDSLGSFSLWTYSSWHVSWYWHIFLDFSFGFLGTVGLILPLVFFLDILTVLRSWLQSHSQLSLQWSEFISFLLKGCKSLTNYFPFILLFSLLLVK